MVVNFRSEQYQFGNLYSDFDPCWHIRFCSCLMVKDDFRAAERNCLNKFVDVIFLHYYRPLRSLVEAVSPNRSEAEYLFQNKDI